MAVVNLMQEQEATASSSLPWRRWGNSCTWCPLRRWHWYPLLCLSSSPAAGGPSWSWAAHQGCLWCGQPGRWEGGLLSKRSGEHHFQQLPLCRPDWESWHLLLWHSGRVFHNSLCSCSSQGTARSSAGDQNDHDLKVKLLLKQHQVKLLLRQHCQHNNDGPTQRKVLLFTFIYKYFFSASCVFFIIFILYIIYMPPVSKHQGASAMFGTLPHTKNPQRIKTIVVTTITNDASAVSYDS